MSKAPTRRLAPSSEPGASGVTPTLKIGLVEFARRLHDLRTARGWNQSDLAREVWGEVEDNRGRMVARNRDRISQYEQGRSFPDPANLRRIADVFGVSIDELAPGVTAATVDREVPAVSFVSVQGHPDKTHLQVNTLVPYEIALEIAALVHKAQRER